MPPRKDPSAYLVSISAGLTQDEASALQRFADERCYSASQAMRFLVSQGLQQVGYLPKRSEARQEAVS